VRRKEDNKRRMSQPKAVIRPTPPCVICRSGGRPCVRQLHRDNRPCPCDAILPKSRFDQMRERDHG
jgi:hypothetical protein